jgi:glutamyl-tRNA reductase
MNGRRLLIDSQPFSNLEFFNLRTTYKTTPIHKLETFTFADVDFAYKQFLRQEGVSECVILQTCNRVEIYLVMENYRDNNILNLWFDIAKIPSESIKYIEINQGKKVISHLLRLASGLESLVIGENQILGQIKRAYEYAKRYNYCNSSLALAFDRAIKTGTRIRNQTGLSKGSVSVGSMAVNLAEEYFEELNAKKILVIGTGEAASLIAKSLRRRNVEFLVASRTYERAKAFATTVGGIPIEFEKAVLSFDKIDVIFVSTTAPYYLVTYDRISECMSQRTTKSGMMIFDLSNPRTVDDRIASIHRVKLVNIDQISEIVERNLIHRKQEIRLAESKLEFEMQSIDNLFRKIKAEPLVVSVFKKVDELREKELLKTTRRLNIQPGTKEFAVVEQLSHAIVEGIMSTPMNNFRKEIGNNEKNEEILKIVTRIFNYESK